MEQPVLSASGGLGAIHRQIRPLHQRRRVDRLAFGQRNADAGPDEHLMAVDDMAFVDGVDYPPRQRDGGRLHVAGEMKNGEFVAAEPCDEILRT